MQSLHSRYFTGKVFILLWLGVTARTRVLHSRSCLFASLSMIAGWVGVVRHAISRVWLWFYWCWGLTGFLGEKVVIAGGGQFELVRALSVVIVSSSELRGMGMNGGIVSQQLQSHYSVRGLRKLRCILRWCLPAKYARYCTKQINARRREPNRRSRASL